MGEVPLEDLGRQSLSREARYMPRTRVHTGRGHSMGEDRPVDPGSSVTGPYFVGPIDGEVDLKGEDNLRDWSFP